MPAVTTHFSFGDLSSAPPSDPTVMATTMVIGKKSVLKNLDLSTVLGIPALDAETVTAMMERGGSSSSTFVGKAHQLHIATLPESVSRNNHPWSVHTITDVVAKALSSSTAATRSGSRLVFCGDDVDRYAGALASATAKAFPVYTQKTTGAASEQAATTTALTTTIRVSFVTAAGEEVKVAAAGRDGHLQAVCRGVQLAARLVDAPPDELTTTAYAAECRALAEELTGGSGGAGAAVTFAEIAGDELNARGYGGLYGVGKAAACPPRLVVLEYTPPPSTTADADLKTETVALVGKGIVYDSGGLSLKSKDGMPGMKMDMGGSAGLLGGFYAAVKLGVKKRLVLILCLAENAIGPLAFRNDDIVKLYSGKTVEINNTDAEGRLVLADGVAHATRHVANLDLVVDMATLTGAQLVAAGKKHAGILANSAELEQRAVAAGLASGDLVVPLLYAPELLKKEFDSKVADMKNSVKDRSNAQASCAGHFIESHLDPNYKAGWLHIDMAGPVEKDGRGTGYGVGLVLSLLEAPGF